MDVTVVGGGVIGYAVAHELARRGACVSILDMRGAGLGATRASAGILAPYIEGHLDAVLQLGLASLALYSPFINRVSADAGQEVEYRRSGTLQVARSDDDRAHLDSTSRRLRAAGVAHALIDGAEARRLEPGLSDGIIAALRIGDHGCVRVGALMSALVTAVARAGVALQIATVDGLEPRSPGVRIRTSLGTTDADAVVIAAGSWSGPLASPSIPVRPVRGQIVEFQLSRPPVAHVVWGDACYMVPWSDGTVLVGATSEDVGFDDSVSSQATDRLTAAGRALVPALADAPRTDARAGLRPATPDELPVIGRSSTLPGVFFATGHYRHGVLLAPLTATLVADLVLEGRADPLLDLVRPERFGL